MRKLILPSVLLLSVASAAFAAEIPRPAPAKTYATTEGPSIDLAKYKGKVVVLEFILTTCPHCQAFSKLLQKMNQEYGPRGFQALAVAINDGASMMTAEFKKNQGVTFPVGYAKSDAANDFMQIPMMVNYYMPQVAFIDRKGMIRAQFGGQEKFFEDGEPALRAQIESLLKEKATAAPSASAKAAPRTAEKK